MKELFHSTVGYFDRGNGLIVTHVLAYRNIISARPAETNEMHQINHHDS